MIWMRAICLLALIALAICVDASRWRYTDLDKILEDVDINPAARIAAVREELQKTEARQNKWPHELLKIKDMKLFLSLEELTKPESCNQAGFRIMHDNESKLAGRQFIAKVEPKNRGPTMQMVIHYGLLHAELCQSHYLREFLPKWRLFPEEMLDYIEALTTPLIDWSEPALTDTRELKLAQSVKSWTIRGSDDPVNMIMFNLKANGLASVDSKEAANLVRSTIVDLGRDDPQLKCLQTGLLADLRRTLDRLSFRYQCDVDSILNIYVYKPCANFIRELSNPLEMVSYDLLLNKKIMNTTDRDMLDMHLAAGRNTICHQLLNNDPGLFEYHIKYDTQNLPVGEYLLVD